jgi:hypothetical protein
MSAMATASIAAKVQQAKRLINERSGMASGFRCGPNQTEDETKHSAKGTYPRPVGMTRKRICSSIPLLAPAARTTLSIVALECG